MTDDEVQHYFINKAHEKTCGRFYNTQLQEVKLEIDIEKIAPYLTWYKKFALACLIVFGSTLFSCTNYEDENIELKNKATGILNIENTNLDNTYHTKGKPIIVEAGTIHNVIKPISNVDSEKTELGKIRINSISKKVIANKSSSEKDFDIKGEIAVIKLSDNTFIDTKQEPKIDTVINKKSVESCIKPKTIRTITKGNFVPIIIEDTLIKSDSFTYKKGEISIKDTIQIK
jgi:hypothetical protein